MDEPLRYRPSRRANKRRSATPLIWLTGIVLVGVVLFFPVALATDRPAFCPTCHEMSPFNEQWAAGQHASTAQCIDCHVDAGLPARFAHKFVALGEVASHFSGDTGFPRPVPASVPNARCTRCHTTLPKSTPGGFSHDTHLAKATCAACHATTGHNVTIEALKAAGIFSGRAASSDATVKFAALDRGAANIAGHRPVVCSRCHDMAKTGCARCHTPPPKHFAGQCSQCHHDPGGSWKFRHPSTGEHSWRSTPCVKCHPQSYAVASCTCHGGRAPSGD